MTTKPAVRESRSVRLRQDEWDTAEAIGRIRGERSAGFGLRAALSMAEDQLTEQGRGGDLDRIKAEIKAERTAGGQ